MHQTEVYYPILHQTCTIEVKLCDSNHHNTHYCGIPWILQRLSQVMQLSSFLERPMSLTQVQIADELSSYISEHMVRRGLEGLMLRRIIWRVCLISLVIIE